MKKLNRKWAPNGLYDSAWRAPWKTADAENALTAKMKNEENRFLSTRAITRFLLFLFSASSIFIRRMCFPAPLSEAT